MAYIVRDGELVPVAIPLNQRVKIGRYYQPPQINHIANDQLWLQDVYTFNKIPWYMIKNRFEKYMLYFILYGSIVTMLSMIGRYYLGAPW